MTIDEIIMACEAGPLGDFWVQYFQRLVLELIAQGAGGAQALAMLACAECERRKLLECGGVLQ